MAAAQRALTLNPFPSPKIPTCKTKEYLFETFKQYLFGAIWRLRPQGIASRGFMLKGLRNLRYSKFMVED